MSKREAHFDQQEEEEEEELAKKMMKWADEVDQLAQALYKAWVICEEAVQVDTLPHYEDNDAVLDVLVKNVVNMYDGVIDRRLLSLRLVNRAWKAAVDRLIRTCQALTIEVTFSKRAVSSNSVFNVQHHQRRRRRRRRRPPPPPLLSYDRYMYVHDVAGEFGRLSRLSGDDAVFELKGPLIRLSSLAQLTAFKWYLRRSVLAGVDQITGRRWTMKQRELSLAITDTDARSCQELLSTQLLRGSSNMHMEAYFSMHFLHLNRIASVVVVVILTLNSLSLPLVLPSFCLPFLELLQLERLFPRLEALYLNFALDDVVKAYYGRLLEGVAERRSSRRGRGQPQPWPRPQLKLKVLNINIVEGYLHGDWLGELTAKVLRPLLPQLEHFGPVFARYDLKKVLRFSAKLTSLKVDFLERGFEGIPQYRVKQSAKRVAHRLAGITSLVLATPTLPPLPDQWGEFEDEDEDEDDEVGELLKHCTGVRRMKMVRKRFRMVYEQHQVGSFFLFLVSKQIPSFYFFAPPFSDLRQ